MATSTSTSVGPVTSFDLGENQKRWVVVGICLHRVLSPVLREFVGQEVPKYYATLKSAHRIDTQVFKGPHLTHDGSFKLNYGSINNNWKTFKKKESSYDYKVNMAEDLAKLYLEPHMAKFTGFDNTCDLSAVLGILVNASIFPPHIQPISKDVRSNVRNEWGHCNFDHWTDPELENCIQLMEKLLQSLGLTSTVEAKVLADLCDWKEKGLQLCMGCPVDKDLMKLVNDQVANLEHDVEVMKKSGTDEAQKISYALQNVKIEITKRLTELEKSVMKVEVRQDVVEGRQDVVEGRQDVVDGCQDVVEGRQDVVEGRQDVVEGRQDVVEGRQDVVEVRQDVVEGRQDVVEVRQDVVEVRQDVVEVRQDVVEVRQDVVEGRQDVVEVRQDVVEGRQDVVEVRQDVVEVRQDVVEGRQDVVEGRQDVVEGRQDVVEGRQDVVELRQYVVEVRQDVVEVRQDVVEVRQDVVEGRQDVVEGRQDMVEGRQDVVERKQNAFEASVTSKVDVLERRLHTSSNDVAFLAPRRNSCFCGRDNELGSIAANLKGTTNGCVHTAICGLGGVGKTSLAVEFSWRHKKEYPGGIFWISGENNRLFQNSVREMALEMHITTLENDFSFTLTKALAWLKRQSQLWCLVIDNLDELEMSEDMRKLIRGKWKQGARGHIIITTRREPREIRKETGIEERSCFELKCFTQEESVEFLRKQTNRMDGEDKEICELVIELGGLPLALDQAAAYIRYLSCSMKEYVEQYRDQKSELLKKMETQEPHECTSCDRLAVHTTWLMNFEHITNSSRYKKELRVAATLVMEISAYLGPDDIPNEVINKGLPQVDFPGLVDVMSNPFGRKEVMSLLTKLSLFQQFWANSYCVHRLVQEVIRGWMDEKRKDDAFNKEFFTKEFSFHAGTRFMHHAFVNTCSPVEVCEDFGEDAPVFSVDNPPSLHLWGKLALHATYLQEHLLDFTAKNEESASALLYTEETVRLLNEVALFFSVAREKVKAQEIQKRKLEFLTHLKQPLSKETLNILLYFNMPLKNRYYKLISHCMKERPSSREDLNEAQSNANQLREEGNQAIKCEDYKKASGLYTKAIELYSKDYRLYSNRALCYLKLSKPQNALSDCEECLSLEPHYSKALQRKAWALHELVESGSDRLKGCALATAALAIHFKSNAHDKKVIKKMFPDLCYRVIANATALEFALQMPEANKTLLLLEGEYNMSRSDIGFDLQIVGLGLGAVLNCRGGFAVCDARCYLENITFPRGIPSLVSRGQAAVIQINRCQISAGFAGCQDYPECNGGQGCIAASVGKPPCSQTNEIGTFKESGIAGFPGVQVNEGSTGHIHHCKIHHSSYGAAVNGEGSRLFVRNCDVFRNGRGGLIAANGGQLVASENKVYDNGTYGFIIGQDAGCCLIRSNMIFENNSDGIYVSQSKQEVSVDSNYIHHNMSCGLSFHDCHLSITNNKIFENVLWGIFSFSRTKANIKENVIFSNKCGGICIGANSSARINIQTNVVRDHAGPWFYQHTFTIPATLLGFNCSPEKGYILAATLENNQEFNNVEGLFHPKEKIEGVQSRCCHCSQRLRTLNLRRCPECYIAVYCGKECLDKQLAQHKSLCADLKSRYSTTIGLPPPFLPPSFSSKRNNRQAFIVKVESRQLGFDYTPNQMLYISDQIRTLDFQNQNPEVCSAVMECGVLDHLCAVKKAFFWATFADGRKKLNIFLNHLAPYQEW